MKKNIFLSEILLSVSFILLLISLASGSRFLQLIPAAIIFIVLVILFILKINEKEYKKDSEPLESAEAELPQEEKMAYIGTVAAGLAHEIRNPLNAIDFNIRMIQEDIESGDWDKNDITDRFRSTYKEIKHLERLVNDFLLYARKKALQLGQTDPVKLLESVKGMLSEIADSHKVSIIVQSGDVPEIEADGEVLKQAIFNIAKNGIEAMNEGGKLLMAPEYITDGDRVLIKITDNGNGIQPHDLKKIFHLFYSTRRSGTGIGLPVAKSIIENHNGWIEIDSKLGVGTTFDIYLPRRQEEGDDNGK
jgi:signal transduction histidine kinase